MPSWAWLELFGNHVLTYWIACAPTLKDSAATLQSARVAAQPDANKSESERPSVQGAVSQSVYVQLAAHLPLALLADLAKWPLWSDARPRRAGGVVALFLRWIKTLVVGELVFYVVHRMLHHPWWYKHVHARHHRWKHPVPVAALDTHPFEHVVSNLMPVYCAIRAGGLSRLEAHLLTTVVTWHTTRRAHSATWPDAHAAHHTRRKVNFGTGNLLFDRLLGTFDPK